MNVHVNTLKISLEKAGSRNYCLCLPLLCQHSRNQGRFEQPKISVHTMTLKITQLELRSFQSLEKCLRSETKSTFKDEWQA